MKLFFAAAAVAMMAAEPDPRLLRLLTGETEQVTGIDWDRYRTSSLSGWFSVSLQVYLPEVVLDTARIRQIVTIGPPDNPSLIVLFGEFTAPLPSPAEGARWHSVAAGPGVILVGPSAEVAAALAAWKGGSAEPPAWSARLKELGAEYDNWAHLRNPIPGIGPGIAPAPLPHWAALQKSVVDASFGVRFGATIGCFASATMATYEDAASAAALARWLPAFAESRSGNERELASLAEQFDSRQNGRSVEVRFAIQEKKIPRLGIAVY